MAYDLLAWASFNHCSVTKEHIRLASSALRAKLSKKARMAADNQILEQLEHLPAFQKAQIICTYISHGTEVDTRKLIQKYTGKKIIIIPHIRKKTGKNRLILKELKNTHELKPHHFGILSIHEKKTPFDAQKIECTLVPGIAFARNKHRIGHGHGFYDELLSQISGVKIGLAYACQIHDHIPEAAHDVPMDVVITENGLIS